MKLTLITLLSLVALLVVLAPSPAHANVLCCCQWCFPGGPCQLIHCGSCPQLCEKSGPDSQGLPGVSTLWTVEAKAPTPLAPNAGGLHSTNCTQQSSLLFSWDRRINEIEKSVTLLK